MADNMTIGPALAIGGNKVEMTQQGKIQVTNPQGKIKTLSQDEFKKQLIKNADKIEAGEDFEFKKDKKGLKIAGAAVGVAAVTTGIIYRKQIGNYLKDFSWKKFGEDIKNLFKSTKDKVKAKIAGKSEDIASKRQATYSKEQAANDAHRYYANNFESQRLTSLQRDDMIAVAQAAFADYDPVKFKKSKALENAGLTKEEYDAVKEYAASSKNSKLTKARKAVLPHWLQDKESCQRYVNAIEAKFAKIDEQFGKLADNQAK